MPVEKMCVVELGKRSVLVVVVSVVRFSSRVDPLSASATAQFAVGEVRSQRVCDQRVLQCARKRKKRPEMLRQGLAAPDSGGGEILE